MVILWCESTAHRYNRDVHLHHTAPLPAIAQLASTPTIPCERDTTKLRLCIISPSELIAETLAALARPPHYRLSLHDAALTLLSRRMILLLAQEQQEVAGLLLMLGRERVVEREEGVALAVRLGEFVVILFGRLADQIERCGAEDCRQRLQLGDAWAGGG